MYRCAICNKLSEPRQPRLLHTVYRYVKKVVRAVVGTKINHEGISRKIYEDSERLCHEPAAELAVCKGCHISLKDGATPAQLRAAYKVTHDHAAPEYKEGPPRPKSVYIPVSSATVPNLSKRQQKQRQREERLAAMEGKIVTR